MAAAAMIVWKVELEAFGITTGGYLKSDGERFYMWWNDCEGDEPERLDVDTFEKAKARLEREVLDAFTAELNSKLEEVKRTDQLLKNYRTGIVEKV